VFAFNWPTVSEYTKKANEHPVIFLLTLLATLLTIILSIMTIYAWGMSPTKIDITCTYCEGTGQDPNKTFDGESPKPCPICKGHGHIETERVGQRDCAFCKGSGQLRSKAGIDPCTVCGGIGLEPKE
jgi:hypothetical protein